ncbi:indole-3-glycerol phosphate synthase TrpC [Coriobacteriia bacterium Es71-Z0120]|uniref:indole-3-glycerol phosphate synthase TrpC n=1 Tax=Parvivirga hydrogeniphila TaxID=2939460 RepID=UPI002260C322|nr:indole-3-glycerol phosphate synthase TrpC [Parvivirga hydrogeniphila]MCL4078826.1 indole-3-glycerol phosphate synthase TrpC [Parvivirga hydrogeniphila]
MSVLAKIVASRKARVAREFTDAVRADLVERAAHARPARPFSAALTAPQAVAVIAEVKRSSPSAGGIALGCDARAQAQAYERGHAAAISVLTEPERFGGSFEDLASVSAAVRVPVLCKDFVVDPAQVAAARAAGADAVLLMASVLGQDLPRYLDLTSRFGLEALVEVHDEAELALAVRSGARVVGVNARDLRTLAIDLERAHALVRRAREVADVVVAESGIRSRRDVEAAARAGADAVLVGTALMGAPSPEDAVRELTGVGKENGHA